MESDVTVTTAQSLLNEQDDQLPDGQVEQEKEYLCYIVMYCLGGNCDILHWVENTMLIIIPNLPNGNILPGGCGWVFCIC